MSNVRKRAVAAAALAFALGSAASLSAAFAPTRASEPNWPTEPYAYTVVEQDLADVLETFGTNIGVPVRVSPAVVGAVKGRLPVLPPRAFLENLARTYGFTWYFDGHYLHVSDQSESASALLRLGRVPRERLLRELEQLSLLDERYPIRQSDESNLLFVNGPPRYVALVRETLARMQEERSGEVRIIRGSRGGS